MVLVVKAKCTISNATITASEKVCTKPHHDIIPTLHELILDQHVVVMRFRARRNRMHPIRIQVKTGPLSKCHFNDQERSLSHLHKGDWNHKC